MPQQHALFDIPACTATTTTRPLFDERKQTSMSAVWNYFQVTEDERLAKCKLCSAKISRGGAKRSAYNTSNLIKHLEKKHPEKHAEFKAASASSTTLTQPTLEQTLKKKEKMSIDHPRAQQLSRALTEMIALDDQPLSIVEMVGFRRFMNIVEPKYELPSRSFITTKMLPKVHDAVNKHVHGLMSVSSAISFTTDIWSSSVSPLSLISLTAQWVDSEFTLNRVTLQAKECRGSHTGSAVAETFVGMLEDWNISKEAVHVVVRDNGANIIKAMAAAQLPSISCAAHTLQLAVKEGLLSQRSVQDAVAVGRKIVGHFKHSPLACSQLEDIQIEINQDVKRLQQDVQTRWNSTFYMLQSLIEQKRALVLYGSQHQLPDTLNANQWNLLEKCITVLAPFEELTRKVSHADATASDVIPGVTVLLQFLAEETEDDRGIRTMKETLLQAVKRRFRDTEDNPLFCIATILDPRFKDQYFSDTNNARMAKQMVIQELQKMSSVGAEQREAQTQEDTGEPPASRSQKDKPPSSLDRFYDKIAEEARASQSSHGSTPPLTDATQLDTYIREVPMKRESSPLQYWLRNRERFPKLAQLAQRYLSAPCSSVESERLFSAAANILDEKRNRLSAEHTEMLLFVKKNLPLTFPEVPP